MGTEIRPAYAPGTPVINVHDAEPGTILHGTVQHPVSGVWTEYAVATAYGTERWPVEEFVLLDR